MYAATAKIVVKKVLKSWFFRNITPVKFLEQQKDKQGFQDSNIGFLLRESGNPFRRSL